MKYIVAVSGGVDSVVLLDMMVKVPGHEIIVAHFDHGIREDSAEDARFVAALAYKHGLVYAGKREELGSTASEAWARERRYAFLRELAQQHTARIVTAHHLDDLVETVAINLKRGTGWRGLAALDSDVVRPLIDTPKQQLIKYAQANGLKWHEDSTNASDAYLRNRVRAKATDITHDTKRQLRALHSHQKQLKTEIDTEAAKLVGDGPDYSRYLFTHLPQAAALECLRFITRGSLTRPQLIRCLLAIKTAAAGSAYEAGSGVNVRFGTRHFSL
ncbi:MAG: tRNA(Ile)-lysidine synthase [Candidatus Saccharibacteria bacterium]|nr:tRNA(Ile)-lysidine synthase [Candidatus Saccharibacteria bacterium]MDB5180582.1 tRNA(Ile)-lysidine synthase [Candidatus Saccharibacteria bacterium]